ncbi:MULTISPECIES: DUF3021 domain-containing protein [unclassified Gemella]|uniref:DUF3021 domain-containing protein n=1 Tax=unclassified Gemella TaxID=2624949 RepID=UPI0010738D02|nr:MULTISPECIES: DUF3021 domain-containing protein [unclassified Gemella]MBF0710767.1 DUF3021 domain-containing protein [Gemella sp. GL1.1]MBF0746664.1 DUF3021 domain-containing protein [Gemella sp. 19428wG2_WT2a]NYS28111.1 DUF3021 domain-containing protein [Gemella sp. GL1]TFU60014.1 DUF3021 domain-containing protein [Gemella sp. WT2a]
MKTLQNLLKYAMMGIGFSTFISLLLAHIFSYDYVAMVPSFASKFSSTTNAMTMQIIVTGLIGISQAYASKIFSKDLSLLTQTLIHNFLIIISVFAAGIYLHWFKFNIASFILVEIIYFIIYIYLYTSNRIEMSKINAKLNKSS